MPEPPALVPGFDDFAVMRQSIEQRRRHLRITEYAIFALPNTLGHSAKAGLVVMMMEVRSFSRLIVEHDKVAAGQIIGETALAATVGLALQSVDEIDNGVKAASCIAADAGSRDGYREVRACQRR
jgi:hypothetical protein